MTKIETQLHLFKALFIVSHIQLMHSEKCKREAKIDQLKGRDQSTAKSQSLDVFLWKISVLFYHRVMIDA